MKESGTLIIGVEHGGKTHKDFVLHPAKVKYTIEAIENDPRAMDNDQYLGVCILARQIEIGDIPKKEISPAMLMEMFQQDMEEITTANGRLKKKIAGFRETAPTSEADNAGSKKAGVQ